METTTKTDFRELNEVGVCAHWQDDESQLKGWGLKRQRFALGIEETNPAYTTLLLNLCPDGKATIGRRLGETASHSDRVAHELVDVHHLPPMIALELLNQACLALAWLDPFAPPRMRDRATEGPEPSLYGYHAAFWEGAFNAQVKGKRLFGNRKKDALSLHTFLASRVPVIRYIWGWGPEGLVRFPKTRAVYEQWGSPERMGTPPI